MKKTLYRIFLLCLCLTMFVSCGKEANNDPSAQLSKQTTATENKEPSMSILDINKLPEDTTPKAVTSGVSIYSFYRKQINMSEGILVKGERTSLEITSKEEFNAFIKEGFYDDTVKSKVVDGTFSDFCTYLVNGNSITSKDDLFDDYVVIILGEYSEWTVGVSATLFKNNDGSYMIRYHHDDLMSPEYKVDGGFHGVAIVLNRSWFKSTSPILDQIEIDDWSVN